MKSVRNPKLNFEQEKKLIKREPIIDGKNRVRSVLVGTDSSVFQIAVKQFQSQSKYVGAGAYVANQNINNKPFSKSTNGTARTHEAERYV